MSGIGRRGGRAGSSGSWTDYPMKKTEPDPFPRFSTRAGHATHLLRPSGRLMTSTCR